MHARLGHWKDVQDGVGVTHTKQSGDNIQHSLCCPPDQDKLATLHCDCSVGVY